MNFLRKTKKFRVAVKKYLPPQTFLKAVKKDARISSKGVTGPNFVQTGGVLFEKE